MRRSEYEASRDVGLQLLDQCDYATLGLIDQNGLPYTVAISVAREGDTIYFHSATEGFKNDCIRAHPAVCLTAVGEIRFAPFTVYYESVTARGNIIEIADEEDKRHAMRIICERYSPESMDKFAAVTYRVDRLAVWKIELTDVSAKRKFPKEEV